MAGTYGDMQTRIADEISRTDLTSQIQLAIQTAIKAYERERFYFNETNSITFNTVAAQEEYTSSDHASIPNLLKIDDIRITIAAGNIYLLVPVGWDELEALSSNVSSDQGYPTTYAYYARKLRFYPIPNATYAMRITGVAALAALSATTDANDWMTEGEDLIRCRAKRELYSHVIRDQGMAAMCGEMEAQALQTLRTASGSRSGTGFLTATQF